MILMIKEQQKNQMWARCGIEKDMKNLGRHLTGNATTYVLEKAFWDLDLAEK